MEEFLEALKVIFLGLVEGITESLPMSGSGHDFLLQRLLGLGGREGFPRALRGAALLGVALAVFIYYFRRLWPFKNRRLDARDEKELKKMSFPRAALMRFVWAHCDGARFRLWGKLLLASLPALILSRLVGETLKNALSNGAVVGAGMMAGGAALVLSDRLRGQGRTIKKVGQLDVWTVLIIGSFQVLSLLPGVSRMGVGITAALLLGATRGVAAEFTFFLGIPVILGSAPGALLGAHRFTGLEGFFLLLGMLVAFGISLAAIRFLRGHLRSGGFLPFGLYQICLGAAVILYQLFTRVFAGG